MAVARRTTQHNFRLDAASDEMLDTLSRRWDVYEKDVIQRALRELYAREMGKDALNTVLANHLPQGKKGRSP